MSSVAKARTLRSALCPAADACLAAWLAGWRRRLGGSAPAQRQRRCWCRRHTWEQPQGRNGGRCPQQQQPRWGGVHLVRVRVASHGSDCERADPTVLLNSASCCCKHHQQWLWSARTRSHRPASLRASFLLASYSHSASSDNCALLQRPFTQAGTDAAAAAAGPTGSPAAGGGVGEAGATRGGGGVGVVPPRGGEPRTATAALNGARLPLSDGSCTGSTVLLRARTHAHDPACSWKGAPQLESWAGCVL
jgi:hypothetical protein